MKQFALSGIPLFVLAAVAVFSGCFGAGDPMLNSDAGEGWINSHNASAGASSVSSGGSASSSSIAATPVVFTGLAANGTSGTVTTTELTLTFDADPTTLAAGDITVTGATKGALSGSGTTRTLAISAITVANDADVVVTVASPAGFLVSGSPRTVQVRKAPTAVTFTNLTANGRSGSVDTTELTLFFDTDPVTLAAGDITVTGATKGALSGSGLTRTLTISEITVLNDGNVNVTLANPAGFVISSPFQSVAVYVDLISGVQYREMVLVPAGLFTQQEETTSGTLGGSFQHSLAGFNIGKYEVTYPLWFTVKAWAVAHGYLFQYQGQQGSSGTQGNSPTTQEPATKINWRDAIVWCNAYSQMTGLTPVYCSDSGFTIPIKDSRSGSYNASVNTTPGSFDNPYVNWGGCWLPVADRGSVAVCSKL